MDIIKIIEEIKSRKKNNALKNRTFTEDLDKFVSKDSVYAIGFIDEDSLINHDNYTYSRGIRNPILFFNNEPITEIHCFSDDDFVRDPETT